MQDRYDNKEDNDQKAEEEHHGLEDHSCRAQIRASGLQELHCVQHPTTRQH